MQLYNCKVRLSGSLYNEVPKDEVTAAEITLLRVIHGNDGVADIVHKGEVERSDIEERGRLNFIYGGALHTIDEIKSINGVFGVAGALPDKIAGVEIAEKPKAAAAAKPGRKAKADIPAENIATDADVDPEFT